MVHPTKLLEARIAKGREFLATKFIPQSPDTQNPESVRLSTGWSWLRTQTPFSKVVRYMNVPVSLQGSRS
jgi:hypothetical protein